MDKKTKEALKTKTNSQDKIDDKVIEIKESEYKALVEEAASYKDKYIRLYAEFENARKRMEREKLEFLKYANEEIIGEFLNILDDLERSVAAAQAKHEDYQAFLKGIEMVMAHVYEMLKKNGVKAVEAKGKQFDPHHHEVLMQEESKDHEDGTVIEEFQRGYIYNDKVIRTAKVKVAKNIKEG
ncbi:MAG TPA: nucleotide exchange factor GrpE [Candidatus Omnitrophota bacterium]|nr:nucleotide exchange factor GrpE [Candidatus Omnitrophota bacterium]